MPQPVNIEGLGIVEFEDGMTAEQIEAAIVNDILPTIPPPPVPPVPEKEYAGFFESFKGAAGDFFDASDTGSSALLPGGENPTEAATRGLEEAQNKPERPRFSLAEIEAAWEKGGFEGLQQLQQLLNQGVIYLNKL